MIGISKIFLCDAMPSFIWTKERWYLWNVVQVKTKVVECTVPRAKQKAAQNSENTQIK